MAGRWLLRKSSDKPIVLAVPFAGCGPSIYNGLKRRLATEWGVECIPVQPPGIESRFSEERISSHGEYARGLATEIGQCIDGDYTIFGHCGAVPYVIETLRTLEDIGGPLPDRVVFSGWGPPNRGLYGTLNTTDEGQIDYGNEVRRTAAETGAQLIDEFVEIYAEQLEYDVRQQRSYQFETLAVGDLELQVVGWSNDEVVGSSLSTHPDWQIGFPNTDISFTVLVGGHFSFIDAPNELCRLLAEGLV